MPPRRTRSQQRRQQAKPKAEVLRQQAQATVQEASFYDNDPIKQYVRRHGWLDIVRNYIERFQQSGIDRTWKYLTLPGKDASDIGLLWTQGLLKKEDDGSLNIAICDAQHAESVVAALTPLGSLIGYSSNLLHDELTDRYSHLAKQFPFDVINLDLCNAFIQARPPLEKFQANLRTIDWIFRLQKGQGFLLLLTSRALEEINQELRQILGQNLEQEERFRNAYQQKYGGQDIHLCLRDFTSFTQIIFPKVLAKWARDFGYQTHERFVARYRRVRGGFDMICHSLEFEPLGVRQDVSKYKCRPLLKTIPPNTINDRLHNCLSTSVIKDAADKYVDFIESLLQREPQDILEILHDDPKHEAELQEEAKFLGGYRWLQEAAS